MLGNAARASVASGSGILLVVLLVFAGGFGRRGPAAAL